MNTEQKEKETVEEDSEMDAIGLRVSDLAFYTQDAIISILTVLKQFKKDHYDSEGDELDELLGEIQDSIDAIYELA